MLVKWILWKARDIRNDDRRALLRYHQVSDIKENIGGRNNKGNETDLPLARAARYRRVMRYRIRGPTIISKRMGN